MIRNNSSYEFAGIYADQGISGTKMDNRPEFLRMVDDALSGKIDIIYCKSISRFARNAAMCQETVRKLKASRVEVIFEKEQLSSFNPMSEMVFNFLTIIAEEESRSISENTIWALDRLAEQGIRRIGNNKVFGYDEIDGKLVPNLLAKAVRMVFMEYASGTSVSQIVKYLGQMGVVKMRSHKPMHYRDVSRMITNVVYKGDRIIQKKPHIDYLTKKPDLTREYSQVYVKGAHEAIVSEGLWEACQIEMARRNKEKKWKRPYEKSPVQVRQSSHPLFGKVICGECGSPYHRITVISNGASKKVWRCKRLNGECHSHYMDEEKILKAIGNVNIEFVDRFEVIGKDEYRISYKRFYRPIPASGHIDVSFAPLLKGHPKNFDETSHVD